MRLLIKLFLMIVAFAGVAHPVSQHAGRELVSDVRVSLIYRFGSPAHREALLEEIEYANALAAGGGEYCLKVKRYTRLLAERVAAARADCPDERLPDEQLMRIRLECVGDVFGSLPNQPGWADAWPYDDSPQIALR